jgi:hypothetical protein
MRHNNYEKFYMILKAISKIRLGFNKKQVELCEIPRIGSAKR